MAKPIVSDQEWHGFWGTQKLNLSQLRRLMPKKFLSTTPYVRLQHFARYLKAITLRLDKYRADPARDALRMSFFAQELRTPQPVSIKRIQKSFEQLAL